MVFLLKTNCQFILELKLQNSEDMDNEIDEILQDYESKIKRQILHSIAFY